GKRRTDMPKYAYIALDAQGKETRGEIEADNQNAAISRIREKGMFPTSVSEAGSAAAKKAERARPAGSVLKMELKMPVIFSRVKAKLLCTWTRQLATLVNAGLPLLRGLRVLVRQERNPALKRAVSNMAESIESGSTFAEALAQHPKIFNKLFRIFLLHCFFFLRFFLLAHLQVLVLPITIKCI
ncbi:MAG TPA: type II secretion system F family protein, partial [Sphaerochaeta sp.]|nr:type II secretion system F family protein [Sphaerochaeta sp.]